MSLKLKTPPSVDVVSLVEAKQHCRVDHTDDDTIIQAYIDGAISRVDGYRGLLGRAIVNQEWELTLDAFPCGDIEIPLGPLVSVASVEYIAPNATSYATWASANYTVDASSYEGRISAVDAWPDTKDTLNAVRVTFIAGHGPAVTDVPPALRVAILMLVGHWYANRESVAAGPMMVVPETFSDLISTFKKPTV